MAIEFEFVCKELTRVWKNNISIGDIFNDDSICLNLYEQVKYCDLEQILSKMKELQGANDATKNS